MADQTINCYNRERFSFLRRHQSKVMALAFWLVVVSVYWWIADQQELAPTVMVKQLGYWFVNSVYGPILFILFFMVQPLVFFPSALMAIMGGYLYGARLGLLVTLIGANGAGLTSYLVGRFFGEGVLEQKDDSLRYRYVEQVRQNSFETILMMHLIFLPYDLVNYMAGFLRVNWNSFVLATALGSLPGIFTFVLFGASFEGDMINGSAEVNIVTLALSLAIMIGSLGLSRYLKSRQKAIAPDTMV